LNTVINYQIMSPSLKVSSVFLWLIIVTFLE
jgi:hypothetical protein